MAQTAHGRIIRIGYLALCATEFARDRWDLPIDHFYHDCDCRSFSWTNVAFNQSIPSVDRNWAKLKGRLVVRWARSKGQSKKAESSRAYRENEFTGQQEGLVLIDPNRSSGSWSKLRQFPNLICWKLLVIGRNALIAFEDAKMGEVVEGEA